MIIAAIAAERRVERMVSAVCKGQAVERDDLAQIVYEALCEKPEEWVERAHREGWLQFWLLNYVKRLATEKRGRYGSVYRAWSARAREITAAVLNIAEDDGKGR